MRRCTACRKSKSVSEFYKHPRYRDGRRPQCKTCLCAEERERRGVKEHKRKCTRCKQQKSTGAFRRTTPATRWCTECLCEVLQKWRGDVGAPTTSVVRRDRLYLYRLATVYGITVEKYDEMFDQQGGTCAICHDPPNTANTRSGLLHVDHCHKTKEIRSLLCQRCNLLLGHAQDCVERLDAAKAYLLQHAA